MNILYIGDSLQWGSQIWLHSSYGSPQSLICHLLLPPAPEVHCEEHLQESGVLCDNPGLSCHSCPSQLLSTLTAVPSDFVSTLVTLGVCFLRDVCVLRSKREKELQAKGEPLVLPFPGSVPISPKITCHLCGKEHDPSKLPFRGHGKNSVLLKWSEMKNYFIYLIFNNFQSIIN